MGNKKLLVQASDGYFFEQFSKSPEPEEDPPGQDNQLTIVKLSINDNNERLYDLYVETLYTIVHKIGRSSPIPETQLIKYAKDAFQIDGQYHQKLLDKAMKEKPPIVLLNVHLLEARDLIAKDINGFSDPFAMMGIIPDQRRISDIGEENSGDEGLAEDLGTPASPKDKKTLNPKWNEKFQLFVDDVEKDMFHLDIWDHDDEDRSVLDAVASLNQVSGLKGIGRYFKEITQSARASDNDFVDDFLGAVTLRIADIPSSGLEEWFDLEKRSEKSEVSGKVKLKLWLSTREERSDEIDDLMDVKQHIELIRQFALQEIRISGAPVSFYQGNLPETATTILHQHAIQGDLTELHQAMCHWLAYSAMLNIGISYAFLYDILTKLISLWAPLALDKDEENMLGESFIMFDNYCKSFLLEHRQKINVKKRSQVDSFANMIRCLKLLRDSPLYSKCVIYQKSLDEDLNHVLRESANKYFNDKVKEFQNDESPCTEFHDIVRSLIKACHKFTNFDPIFKTYAGIDYCDITYREFDRLLNDYICAEMMSEKKKDLKTSLMSIPEDEHSLNMVLKVHFALSEFKSFRVPKQKYRLDNLEWDTTFDRAICKWMDIARTKAFARVDLACQLDAQIQITANEVRHTSSYVDICHIVEQMLSAWDRMEVKDVCLRAELTEKLVQCICKIAEYYIDRVMAQLATDGFCGQLQPFLPPALVNIFCAAINNCEQVRRTLIVGEKLRLDELLDAYKLKTHKEPKWRANIDKDLETCEKFIGEQIDCTIDRMSRRQLPQLKKHVFHLAWSPAACPVDQALKPLTDM
uniref:C2 domain-containing protein n=1 Tax=Acrobeloides nanus TaxID=290746 RepID=A0A914DYX8_9BILA